MREPNAGIDLEAFAALLAPLCRLLRDEVTEALADDDSSRSLSFAARSSTAALNSRMRRFKVASRSSKTTQRWASFASRSRSSAFFMIRAARRSTSDTSFTRALAASASDTATCLRRDPFTPRSSPNGSPTCAQTSSCIRETAAPTTARLIDARLRPDSSASIARRTADMPHCSLPSSTAAGTVVTWTCHCVSSRCSAASVIHESGIRSSHHARQALPHSRALSTDQPSPIRFAPTNRNSAWGCGFVPRRLARSLFLRAMMFASSSSGRVGARGSTSSVSPAGDRIFGKASVTAERTSPRTCIRRRVEAEAETRSNRCTRVGMRSLYHPDSAGREGRWRRRRRWRRRLPGVRSTGRAGRSRINRQGNTLPVFCPKATAALKLYPFAALSSVSRGTPLNPPFAHSVRCALRLPGGEANASRRCLRERARERSVDDDGNAMETRTRTRLISFMVRSVGRWVPLTVGNPRAIPASEAARMERVARRRSPRASWRQPYAPLLATRSSG